MYECRPYEEEEEECFLFDHHHGSGGYNKTKYKSLACIGDTYHTQCEKKKKIIEVYYT